jgi:hypothetical protein
MIKKVILTAALALGISPLAQANIIYQLTNASQTGAPGDTLLFFVTLTNTSTTDQVWLNGTRSTASSPFLSIDTSPFNSNAPLFLDPLAVSPVFEVFDVAIAPATPDGPYIGSIVSIQGGADGGTGTLFDDLADISFDVQAQSTTFAAPEPGTFWTLCLVLLAAGLTRTWRRRSGSV